VSVPWDRRPVDERDYFARLGDGLVVVLPPQPAGEASGGQRRLPHGGAWIHVGEDGVVRAFTGKVEVGQGTRRALALLVAEELRVPATSVQVLMGDTDVSPWDMGTFGSLAMPTAAQHQRAIAATARVLLVELAAARLGVDPARLRADDGRVAGADGRSVGYGELVRGLRRIDTARPDVVPTPPEAWTVAGRPAADGRALEAVTGSLAFVSDLRRAGMLDGRILHPPAHGATLRTIDADRARAVPDVTVVRAGDLVAVAAPDRAAVAEALAAIDARWDRAPQPAEAHIIDYLRAHPSEGEGFWGAMHHEVGDVDRALADAAVTMSATYTAAYIAHVPLECHCAIAEWGADRVSVWVGTQTPFIVRTEVAEALGVSEADVRVVVPPTGGGFGGKHAGDVAVAAALLARASRRPVRVAFTREEEMAWAYFRPFAAIDIRAGAAADGALVAWQFANVNSGANAALTPYRVPHQRIDHQPAESPLPQGSYRALAATANQFARESFMDELAARFGVDPLDYRLRHLDDERLAAVLRAAADRADWAGRRPDPGWGAGIAGGVEKGGRIATIAEVRVGGGGELDIVRIVTAFECGAIVDPDNLRNQVEGATIMGLGGALFEAIHFADGQVLNGRLSQYRVPRFTDVPPIEVVLIDRRDQPSAGGGETPMIAVAPAIANAIFAATGKRVRDLPLAPDGRVR
jgi:isoquinoline 1-oxidoreductase